MLLPIRSKNPPESFPYATVGLIILNVVAYIATSNGLEIKESALKSLSISGQKFDLLHMLTSMFLHADIMHILGNMLFLYLLGFAVEGRMRTWRFLVLYLASGIAGDLLHQAFIGRLHPEMPSLGASGAIMGVMGAALYMFPFAKVTVFYGFYYRFGTADWPMWGIALLYLGLDILFAFIGMADGVGHFAHIGGAAAGLLVAATMRIRRDSADTSEAKAMLSDTKDLSVLSRQELESLHRANPSDTAIIVNWVYRSLRDPGGPRPDCIAAFQTHLQRIMAEQPPGPVAYCLLSLNLPPATVRPIYLCDLATKVEKLGDFQTAMRMYEAVQRNPMSNAGDHESALFRIGMLCESAFANYGRAQICYQEIVSKYGMGPFAEPAKARLAYVSSRQTKST